MLREGQPQAKPNRRRRQLTNGEVLFGRAAIAVALATNILATIPLNHGDSIPAKPETRPPASTSERIPPALRAVYRGTIMESYLNGFTGTRLTSVECGQTSTTFRDEEGEKKFVGFVVVGNHEEGNHTYRVTEQSGPRAAGLNASRAEASKRALVINNWGSTETWVQIGPDTDPEFLLAQAKSGGNTEIYAETPGLTECIALNRMSTPSSQPVK